MIKAVSIFFLITLSASSGWSWSCPHYDIVCKIEHIKLDTLGNDEFRLRSKEGSPPLLTVGDTSEPKYDYDVTYSSWTLDSLFQNYLDSSKYAFTVDTIISVNDSMKVDSVCQAQRANNMEDSSTISKIIFPCPKTYWNTDKYVIGQVIKGDVPDTLFYGEVIYSNPFGYQICFGPYGPNTSHLDSALVFTNNLDSRPLAEMYWSSDCPTRKTIIGNWFIMHDNGDITHMEYPSAISTVLRAMNPNAKPPEKQVPVLMLSPDRKLKIHHGYINLLGRTRLDPGNRNHEFLIEKN